MVALLVFGLAPAGLRAASPPAEPVQLAQAEVILEGAHAGHLLDMDLKRVLALALGVGIGVQAIDLIAMPELRFVGIIGGAMLGEWWYRQKIWPFTSDQPWWQFW